jgi:hypothetical protein
VIDFFVKATPKGETLIEILDGQGQVIRKYSSLKTQVPDEPLDPDDKKPEKEIKVEAGLNRFVWDLCYEEANRVPGYHLWEYNSGAQGPVALPGKYQVRLTVDGKSQTVPLEVKLDPRVQVTQGHDSVGVTRGVRTIGVRRYAASAGNPSRSRETVQPAAASP